VCCKPWRHRWDSPSKKLAAFRPANAGIAPSALARPPALTSWAFPQKPLTAKVAERSREERKENRRSALFHLETQVREAVAALDLQHDRVADFRATTAARNPPST